MIRDTRGGGNKFDLSRWNPACLDRLSGFLSEAGRRGIFVKLTLFSSTHGTSRWALSPFNTADNVNAKGIADWKLLNTLENGNILPHQEKLVRYLALELNGFDNLFCEIQNEPWSDNHLMGDLINPYVHIQKQFPIVVEITTPDSVAWQAAIARTISDAVLERLGDPRGLPCSCSCAFRACCRPYPVPRRAHPLYSHGDLWDAALLC